MRNFAQSMRKTHLFSSKINISSILRSYKTIGTVSLLKLEKMMSRGKIMMKKRKE